MFNKITKQAKFHFLVVIILSTWLNAISQDSTRLSVINDLKIYEKQVGADSSKKMIELKSVIPNLVYDLRYATKNNFLHQQLYKRDEKTFLRLPVVKALSKVQNDLNEKGFGLKIWDAYRPYSVTVKMWKPIKDDRYVADPKKGSGHNRGTAVDLTIINLKTGKELNMGTGFDNFSDTAHQTFTNLPEEILQNRLLLKSTMEKHGFVALATEWWHFYWNEADKFELLDVDFKKFERNK